MQELTHHANACPGIVRTDTDGPDATSLAHCSEMAIEALEPRAGSPAWLVEEVEAIRQGLLDLFHNVVLLRSPDSDNEFTPVRPLPPQLPCNKPRLQAQAQFAMYTA